MVTAIVLISASRDKINETAEKLVELDGVSEVYSVAGPYDLAAVIRAFKTYSRHDLERLFSIGLEEEARRPAT
jgi:DNA-binding Lrp family transcriptional regulator